VIARERKRGFEIFNRRDSRKRRRPARRDFSLLD